MNEIKETSKVFSQINNYCQENNLIFWYEERGSHFSIYVSDLLSFEQNQQQNQYPCSQITQKFINQQQLNIRFYPQEQDKTCSFKLWPKWRLSDQHNHNYRLFFYCFNTCHADFVGKFLFKEFLLEDFTLNKVLIYSKIIFSNQLSREKWEKLKFYINPDELIKFWSDADKVKELTNQLNSFAEKNDIYYFLNTIANFDSLKKFDNCSLNFAKVILTFFSQSPSQLAYYAKNYPLIRELTPHKQLFEQHSHIIEKIIINKADLFLMNQIKEFDANKYDKLIEKICDIFQKNTILKNSGLIEIDKISHVKNIIIYLTFANDAICNKNSFEYFLSTTIKNLKNHENDIEAEAIRENVELIINHWILDKKLPQKAPLPL